MSENCKFSITISYGHRSFEWRPEVGVSDKPTLTLSMFSTHSRWERAMLRTLIEEFHAWLQEEGVSVNP